jgi:HSP20 family molecular chaperone IbpA
MDNAVVQKKQASGTPSVAYALWDPFGFMHEMFGWGRSVHEPVFDAKQADEPAVPAQQTAGAPLFDVTETDGAYVCKFKLTLPDQADVPHAKAERDNGELTLVVPKAAAAKPEASPPPKKRRTQEKGRKSATRKPRRGARSRSHRG